MIATTFGDMSQRLALQRHGTDLKRSVTTLSQELTTGITKDKSRKVNGEFSMLAGVNNAIEMASARKAGARFAELIFASQQTILADLGNQAQTGFLEELSRSANPSEAEISRGIDVMEARFRNAVAQLNTHIAGRALFAGTATDGAALAAADLMLDEIFNDMMTAYPTGLDADTASMFIASWFADGGQFDTSGYLGGSQIPSRLDLGGGATVGLELTAQDQSFRKLLGAFATGAILSRGVFEADQDQQKAMFRHASQSLAVSHLGLVELSARLGIEEERVSNARARAEAEHTAMSIARVELMEADPYETAVRLEQAMTQLDLIYTLTARLSRLNLANYLR